MKGILEYIFENLNINIFEEKDSDKAFLRKTLKDFIKDTYEYKVQSTDKYEILRINFNDLSELEIINFIKKAFNNINNLEVTDEYEIFGRSVGASGTFKSVKIIYNDKKYYIANWGKKENINLESKIKSKDLTPKKLKLKNEYIIDDFNDLYNLQYYKDVTNKLEELSKKINSNDIEIFCKHLIRIILNGDIENKSGSFNSKNIVEFIDNKNEGKITFKFIKDDIKTEFKQLSEGDINNIKKDFGEVLGPFLFIRLFKESNESLKIEFPQKSNEPMVDYYINGFPISAKAEGNSGKPSGAILSKSYERIKKTGNIENVIKDINNEISDNKDNYGTLELDFINTIASTYDMNVSSQQFTLINEFILKDKKIFNFDILDCIDRTSNVKAYKNFVDAINKDIKAENIKEYFDNFYKKIGYNIPSYKYTANKLSEEWFTYTDTNKAAGIIIYPLWYKTIEEINKKYGNDEDVITSVINRELNIKQIYFGISDTYTKLKVVDSSIGKWKFKTGGLSATNIDNSKLAIELK